MVINGYNTNNGGGSVGNRNSAYGNRNDTLGGVGTSINLDLVKLISFCNSTVNNSTEYNINFNSGSGFNESSIIKNINTCKTNVIEELKKVKNNLLLNEKGVSNKYTFIDLQSILYNLQSVLFNLHNNLHDNKKEDMYNNFMNMKGNELVLIYPYVLDIPKNEDKLYSLVNSLLLILHDTYAEQLMTIKKEIILATLEIYKKKINMATKVNVDAKVNVDTDFKKIIFEIANISNINIITIDSLNVSTLYKCENSKKFIILINISDNYYPVYNFSSGYYTSESIFLNYMLTFSTVYINIVDANKGSFGKKDEVISTGTKKVGSIGTKEVGSTGKKDGGLCKKEDGQYYDEVITNEDYSLYVSDIGPKKSKGDKALEDSKDVEASKGIDVSKGCKIVDMSKSGETGSDKKKKNSKNIFIKDNDETDEVFNKTETVDYNELKKMFNKASKLDEIQAIAIKLSIPIVSGSTKEGKPKNRVKNDIINDITKLFSMMII
jgi:hypothetical protein